MSSAAREPITGVWEQSPQPAESRGKAPGQGVREAKPPEAENFLNIGHPKKGANRPNVHVLIDRNCYAIKQRLVLKNSTCQ